MVRCSVGEPESSGGQKLVRSVRIVLDPEKTSQYPGFMNGT